MNEHSFSVWNDILPQARSIDFAVRVKACSGHGKIDVQWVRLRIKWTAVLPCHSQEGVYPIHGSRAFAVQVIVKESEKGVLFSVDHTLLQNEIQ